MTNKKNTTTENTETKKPTREEIYKFVSEHVDAITDFCVKHDVEFSLQGWVENPDMPKPLHNIPQNTLKIAVANSSPQAIAGHLPVAFVLLSKDLIEHKKFALAAVTAHDFLSFSKSAALSALKEVVNRDPKAPSGLKEALKKVDEMKSHNDNKKEN